MSTRTLIVMFFAITFGACAAVGVGRLQQLSAGDRARDLQPVVTVAVDVESGRALDEKCLKLAHYRTQDVPKGALTSIDDAVGCTALVPLVTGEPIVSGKVTGKGAGR